MTAPAGNKKLVSIRILEVVVSIYDLITLPLYYLIYQPWKVRAQAMRERAVQVSKFTWVSVGGPKKQHRPIETIDELFRDSVALYGSKKALGIRKISSVEYKQNCAPAASGDANGLANGKPRPAQSQLEALAHHRVVSKYVLDDKYSWFTFKQVEDMVKQLSAGLVSMCNDSLDNADGSRKLLIAGDTCMQWFLMAHACFRNNITLATTYTTLDDEAILHGIRQTEVKILVVSQKFARRLSSIVLKAPNLDTIILLDEPLPGEENELVNAKKLLNKSGIRRVITYEDLRARGREVGEKIVATPTANDIAILMYTSGSTGKAKGVVLSQQNIVHTARSFVGPGEILPTDRYIGYLPLGHVLELSAECIFFHSGSTIAYSSPMTLTDQSPYIKKGAKGDAAIFKPTIMGAVPLVLDRLKANIQQAVKARGVFFDQLINEWLLNYKSYWWDRYYETPILNYLICRKFNMILGGEMRAICSGGAALTRETQEYLRQVTNFTVIQGYGLTETSAAASFCDIFDRRYNVVGAPYSIVKLRLEDWSDYSVHDKPHPRGEIVIGGVSVACGYYKMDDATRESFYVDETDGTKYFRTGDIGLMLPDGVLRIIDRKKDLVKPLSGEYISLSRIERTLGTSILVENICAYCSQFSNYVVALIRPNEHELRLLAKDLFADQSEAGAKFRASLPKKLEQDQNHSNLIDKISFETLCNSRELTQKALVNIKQDGGEKKLKRNEIPSNIKLVSDEWTAEDGFITASFKLRRRALIKFYEQEIERLYSEIGVNIKVNNE